MPALGQQYGGQSSLTTSVGATIWDVAQRPVLDQLLPNQVWTTLHTFAVQPNEKYVFTGWLEILWHRTTPRPSMSGMILGVVGRSGTSPVVVEDFTSFTAGALKHSLRLSPQGAVEFVLQVRQREGEDITARVGLFFISGRNDGT